MFVVASVQYRLLQNLCKKFLLMVLLVFFPSAVVFFKFEGVTNQKSEIYTLVLRQVLF